MKITIGTRASQLALAQTNLIAEQLRRIMPDCRIEIKTYQTKGDLNLKSRLLEFGGKGAFIEELEEDLLKGRIDLAVHSAKDLTNELSPQTGILSLLPREIPNDVLVTASEPMRNIRIIGTSRSRRELFIQKYYPEALAKLFRGNVNTRIQKLLNGEYDAVILAMAGLKRLNIMSSLNLNFEQLPIGKFVPAACQGIIACQLMRDSDLYSGLLPYRDESSTYAMDLERLVLRNLNAGCHDAVGVFSCLSENNDFSQICFAYERQGKFYQAEIQCRKEIPMQKQVELLFENAQLDFGNIPDPA